MTGPFLKTAGAFWTRLDSLPVRILLLALAYGAFAHADPLLRMPPALASPIWPAAGVALACLLVGGLRLWPGVLLGHLSFSLSQVSADGLSVGIVVQSLAYSTGPTLQAVFAAWIVLRQRAALMPARDGAVLRTVLLAGPVACVIAATWGVSGLALQGYVDAGEFLSTWTVWWFGDSVGMLLFAPLTLLLLPGGRRFWPRRNWAAALPLIGTAAILIPGVYWFHSAEEAEARRPLTLQAERAFDLTAARLQSAATAVIATGHFFASNRAVSSAEFEAFASRMTSAGILAIGWLPRVEAADRAAFEAAARRADQPGFRIVESDGNDGYVPAGKRAAYFPLRFLAVPREQMRPYGYDIASEAARLDTVRRARDSGLPAASELIRRTNDGRQSILLLVPIYDPAIDPAQASVTERRRALRGFVGGLIDPATVSSALAGASAAGLGFRIVDAGADGEQHVLLGPERGAADDRPLLSRDIDFHGRRWRVDVATSDAYWHAGRSLKSRAFLLAALIGTVLIAVQTLAFNVRDRIVSLKVTARSRELMRNRRRLSGARQVAGVAGWDMDVASGLLTLDDRSFDILGTNAAREGGYQMAAREWLRRYVHPDDADGVATALATLAAGEKDAGNPPREVRVRRRDGEIRHLLMHFDVETGSDGEPLRVLGSSQDITGRKNVEIALRESEEYSRSIVESSSDSIMVLSADGRLLDVNSVGVEAFGDGGADSLHGGDWCSIWARDGRADAAAALDTAAAGGSARFTARRSTKADSARWWDVVVSPIPGTDGRPRSLLCVARDVTEEHAAQEKIRRMNEGLEAEIVRRNAELVFSERELRAIFDVAAVGIAHIDRDGKLLRVNPKLIEITGHESGDFVAEDYYRRTHPEDRTREQRVIAELMSGGIDTYELEKRFQRPDTGLIWLHVSGSLVRDAAGEPVYRVEVVYDISEARAEAELRVASERRYRELFDGNPMPMWTYDYDTLAFTSVNEAAIEHYGYSREEFLGMTLRDIRPSDQQSMLDQYLRRRRAGYSPAHEMVHRKKDGSLITVEITSHDVQGSGRPVRLVLANDVTERNRASALLEGQKRVLEEISSGAAVDASLDSLARLAEASTGDVSCAILVADPQSQVLRIAAAPSLAVDFVETVDASATGGSGFFAAIAGCRDALVVSDIATDPLWRGQREVAADHGLHACWSTPILDADGDILGAFVMFYGEPRKPRATEGELVETLTQTAAIAIAKDRETRKLEESEEKFRASFETAALGIILVAPDGSFIRTNPSLTRICGYSEDELRSMTADTLSHPDDIEIGQADRARMFAGEIPSYSVEKRYVHKDGRTVWCSVTLSTVRNMEGEVEYAVALVEDICWRKEAEAELHRQQELNRLLLENLNEGVVACDADGRLLLFNKAAREWHGVDPREIPPDEWSKHYELYDGDGRTPLAVQQTPLMRALRGERVKDVEMSVVRRDHPPRIVLASGAPLSDADGLKRGAVVVMHDVTMRRQSLQKLERAAEELTAANAAVESERAHLAERVAERTAELTAANAALEAAKEAAESASRAKSTFLAVMSHEIRTPMNGILGMVDILSQSSLADDQQDALHTIGDSSLALLRLIDDILDFSKVEAGRLELELTTVSLSEVVENVCESLTPEALANDVDLKLFIDPRLPDRVLSDPTRLRQLLYNLLGNAIKFSGGREEQRGRVEVRVDRGSDRPLDVSFRIADNGVGIAPDVLPNLFDSFTQAEVSTTRRFGGTGLGLAITKRLVDLMQGSIEVTSEPGRGSAFTVTLPLTRAGDESLALDFDLSGLQVLLLDDDAGETSAFATYLDCAGARASSCADPAAVSAAVPDTHGANVIVQHVAAAAPTDGVLIDACAGREDIANLLIVRGTRCSARIVAPHIVVLRASAVRRRDFLRAVAVAAGRASPEAARAGTTELVRGQLVAPTVAQARSDGRLILVAEDDPVNQKVIMRQLALLGYAGELAENGAEALAMWREGTYALLLTDLHMPEMDGYELARRIRSEESGEPRMPILALTANALRGEQDRAIDAGCNAFLTKPLQLSLLGETLERWVPEIRGEQHSGYMQSAGASSRAAPALDREVMASTIGDDPEIQAELLHEYRRSNADQLAELESALAERDSRRLADRAHQQKGAARAIGATKLGDICAELENAARAENHDLAVRLVAQLEAQAAAVDREIGELVGQPAISGAVERAVSNSDGRQPQDAGSRGL